MDPSRSPAPTARPPSISSTYSASGSRPSHSRSGSRTEYSALSSHGMPKEPSLLSPNALVTPVHRFSGLPPSPRPSYAAYPPSPRPSEPRSPYSPMSPMPDLSPSFPGPMSPPMSAKSFGTLIDSEPSTPAYSPRIDSKWDGSSTLVLLPPVESANPSPREPVWDMLVPLQQPPKKRFSRHKPKKSITKDTPAPASLASHPVASIQEETTREKESIPQADAEAEKKKKKKKKEEEEVEKAVEQDEAVQSDPLGKLASRMKSLLRRKTPGVKKPKRQRYSYELDRAETVHWTEL